MVADQQRSKHFAGRESGDAMERHEGRNGRGDENNDRHDLRRRCRFFRSRGFLLRGSHRVSVPQHSNAQLRKYKR